MCFVLLFVFLVIHIRLLALRNLISLFSFIYPDPADISTKDGSTFDQNAS